VLKLLRTADRVAIAHARLLATYGLTSSQYNILRVLRGTGRLPILEIASRLVTAVPGITGLIDRLEAKSLVRRERCDADRRVVYVAILPDALALLGRLDEPVDALNRRLMGPLSSSELDRLIVLLDQVRRGLAESSDRPPEGPEPAADRTKPRPPP
jgi:DNA-binding MarR family transcriptional regulator